MKLRNVILIHMLCWYLI